LVGSSVLLPNTAIITASIIATRLSLILLILRRPSHHYCWLVGCHHRCLALPWLPSCVALVVIAIGIGIAIVRQGVMMMNQNNKADSMFFSPYLLDTGDTIPASLPQQQQPASSQQGHQ
jgi:predicted branched-subunit amino acid permease